PRHARGDWKINIEIPLLPGDIIGINCRLRIRCPKIACDHDSRASLTQHPDADRHNGAFSMAPGWYPRSRAEDIWSLGSSLSFLAAELAPTARAPIPDNAPERGCYQVLRYRSSTRCRLAR